MTMDPKDEIEIFVSYAHEDESFRDQFVEHLSGAVDQGGIRVWSDRQIPPGNPFDAEINVHLETAHIVVALVSSAFVSSEYCYQRERTRADARQSAGEARFIPVIIRPFVLENSDFSRSQLLPRDAIPVDSPRWDSRDAVWTEVVREILGEAERVRDARRSREPLAWNMPDRPVETTGRRSYLDRIWESFRDPARKAPVQIVLGAAGWGQGEAAKEFAWLHRPDYDVAWWVRSGDAETLEKDCAALALALKLPTSRSQERESVRAWLAANEKWLLIFEDAATYQDVERVVPPQPRGHVLVTSRVPGAAWEEFGRVVTIGPSAPPGPDPGANEAAIKPQVDPATGAIPGPAAPAGRQSYVRKTTNAAVGRVVAGFPAEANLLYILGFLASGSIARSLLLEGAGAVPEDLRAAMSDPATLDRSIAVLSDRLLVKTRGPELLIPPLVQEIVVEHLSLEQRSRVAVSAARLVLEVFPRRGQDLGNWLQCEQVVPHARACLDHLHRLGDAPEVSAGLLLRTAVYAHARGQFASASADLQSALDLLAGDTGLYATLLREWGMVLVDLGSFDDSEAIIEQALGVHRANLGPIHSEVADDLMALARTQLKRGRVDDALSNVEAALGMHETTVGVDSPEVADDHQLLADVFVARSDYVPAAKHARESLRIRVANLGAGDPDARMAATSVDLVEQVRTTGRLTPKFFVDYVQLAEEVLGPRHFGVATALRLRSEILRDPREVETRREILERALAIHREVYPAPHYETACDLLNLFAVEGVRGDNAAAEAHFAEAVQILVLTSEKDREAVFREVDLMRILSSLDGLPSQRPLTEIALRRMTEVVGESPEVIPVVLKLVGVYRREIGSAPISERQDTGTTQVRDLLDRALQIAKGANRRLEEAATLNELASLDEELDRSDAALDRRSRALQLHEAVLSPDHHIEVADDLLDLARLLLRRGDWELAKDYIYRSMAIHERVFGPDSDVTSSFRVGALMQLGDALVRAGQLDPAQDAYDESLKRARATETPTDDASAYLRLGMLAAIKGDQVSALSMLRQAANQFGSAGAPSPDWEVLVQSSTLMSQVAYPPAFVELMASFSHEAASMTAAPFQPSILAGLPIGWFAKESITLLSPDGKANIIASSEPVDESIDTRNYAEAQGGLLAQEFPAYEEKSCVEATILGTRRCVLRQFSWTPPDGLNVTQLQAYYVERNRGYTATVTTTTSVFPGVEQALRNILGAVVISGLPPDG